MSSNETSEPDELCANIEAKDESNYIDFQRIALENLIRYVSKEKDEIIKIKSDICYLHRKLYSLRSLQQFSSREPIVCSQLDLESSKLKNKIVNANTNISCEVENLSCDEENNCPSWSCPLCTFLNHPSITSCEMCNMLH